MSELNFSSDYLNNYQRLVEDTESPRIFHLWSSIFAVSSALGRRCYLPFGTGEIHANLYVLLVGNPGTRKSTAARISQKVLARNTGVRFAPSDTGFQRQGLTRAFLGETNQDVEKALLNADALGAEVSGLESLMNICIADDSEEAELAMEIAKADKHALVAIASEFSRVVGQNNLAMLDYLGERYDGESYKYETSTTKIDLPNTLLNMLACTTPTSIANSLPPAAGGQGFLSRIILVYGAKKYKKVPRPREFDGTLRGLVDEVVAGVYREMNGAFTETPAALKFSEELYDAPVEIADARFSYYAERRYTHLIKVAMSLCASRGSMEISVEDYEDAHRILKATEIGMPDALGEFGMNKFAALKQDILEELRTSQGPMTMEQIVAMFHRDARSNEIAEVILEMVNAKLVHMTQAGTGARLLTARINHRQTEDSMIKLLSERKEQ